MGNIIFSKRKEGGEKMRLSQARLNKIAVNIRHEREKRGFTQAGMAESAGISIFHYSQIELGNKAPSLELLITIAEILRISVDTLISGPTTESNGKDICHLF